MESGADVGSNLSQCEAMLSYAADSGADICVLPELFSCLSHDTELDRYAEPKNGALCRWGRSLARRFGIALVMGSFPELPKSGLRAEGDKAAGGVGDKYAAPQKFNNPSSDVCRPYNTCCVFDDAGRSIAAYRKKHLFDCRRPGARGNESELFTPGKSCAVCRVSDDWLLGLGICYDLRFPQHFRELRQRGANIFALPAAFTLETGRDHWEVLLRARAIENQAYAVAANQCGGSGVRRYGRSMIVDPWGTVIAQASDRPGVIMAELDREYLLKVRETFSID